MLSGTTLFPHKKVNCYTFNAKGDIVREHVISKPMGKITADDIGIDYDAYHALVKGVVIVIENLTGYRAILIPLP